MDNLRESLDVFPTEQDFSSKSSFSMQNIIHGKYKDTSHYLNVHFNLLREDFLDPLREAIDSLQNDKSSNSTLDCVFCANYLYKITTLNEIAGVIKLDTVKDLDNIKPGSLIIMSEDNFHNLIFGKILEVFPKSNHFVILFPNENLNLSSEVNYKIFISKNYYEPYYHVLKTLKLFKDEELPLKECLIDVTFKEEKVGYFKELQNPVFKNRKFSEIDKLNEKQREAVNYALKHKFSLIQGPPGTGKTYVGVQIVKNLLKHQSLWHTAPILVLSYTNLALDQYLEGLLEETTEILRVGERSKSVKLSSYNLKDSVKRYFKKNKLIKLLEVKRELDELYYTLYMVYSGLSIVKFEKFVKYHPDFKSSWFSEAEDDDIIDWLLAGVATYSKLSPQQRNLIEKIINSSKERYLEDAVNEEDILEKPSTFYGQPQCKDLIELNEIITNISELKQLTVQTEDTQFMLIRYQCLLLALHGSTKYSPLLDKYTSLRDAEYMDPEKRWILYNYWRKRYCMDLLEKIKKTEGIFQSLSKEYQDYRDHLNVVAMKEKLVVGMTTTCAARMRKTLEKLQCPIVIVEEAAYVLESHIIAALPSNCQQLILLGDHKQLRPQVSSLSNRKTEISLFERMILNNCPFITLDIQYRMRPEISRLISPVYPELKNDTCVENYLNVPGMEKNVFFFDHAAAEGSCRDDDSKNNLVEAKFLVKLARHLVLNGCDVKGISVLAAYKKQVESIRGEMRGFKCLLEVEVCTFDEFQGRENGIVLLSLVRSNRYGKIGFLEFENRITVALSRARFGFYLFGNMELLSKQSKFWEKIKNELISLEAIGKSLRLKCGNHGNIIEVSNPNDFPRDFGCHLECGERLLCGHICRRQCHPVHPQHIKCIQCLNGRTC